jgi:hypothetical protein
MVFSVRGNNIPQQQNRDTTDGEFQQVFAATVTLSNDFFAIRLLYQYAKHIKWL